MYRQRHPDAPNLFSGLSGAPASRHTRHGLIRRLKLEFQRTWLISIFGLVLVASGVGIAFVNEGNAVRTANSLDEGHRKVVIPETNDVVFQENNGKLVFIADKLRVPDQLKDEAYGIAINAVKLKKVVQMYQWYEIEDRKDATHGSIEGDHDGHVETTYSYDTDWFDHRIDSESFNNPLGHHNPEYWPINSTVQVNNRVKMGDFLLGKDLKERFTDFVVFTSDNRPRNSGIKMHAGLYFHADDVWRHQVGDIRIQFSYAGKDGDQVSVVGKQAGREIRPFETESGDILLLHGGLKSVDEIFKHERVANRLRTFLYRGLAGLVSFLGFSCLGPILDIIVMESPLVRNAFQLGFLPFSVSFAFSVTLFVIAVSWIWYRPVLGLILLAFAFLPTFCAFIYHFEARRINRRHRLL